MTIENVENNCFLRFLLYICGIESKTRNMGQQRIYPVGIQDFEKLRTKGAVYIDKTELVYKFVQKDYVFLNRPRRFGKFLLSSTLKYYFQGRRIKIQTTKTGSIITHTPGFL